MANLMSLVFPNDTHQLKHGVLIGVMKLTSRCMNLAGLFYYKQERKIIKNERRCRNDVPKSTQTKKDKIDGKYTSLIRPYIFSQRSKDVGMGLCILTITFILPCLCTFWHIIPTSPFIFNDFSFLFL